MARQFLGINKKEKGAEEKYQEKRETVRQDKDENDPTKTEKKSRRRGVAVYPCKTCLI